MEKLLSQNKAQIKLFIVTMVITFLVIGIIYILSILYPPAPYEGF